jgi:hypothetical protein
MSSRMRTPGWHPSRRGQSALLQKILDCACGSKRFVHDLVSRVPHLGLVAVADGLDEQLAQRLALELELAEHVEDLPAERCRACSSFSRRVR